MLVLLGLLVGFVASLPPGPINLFSISQALTFGFWKSISIRLTVSVMDAIYCYLFVMFTAYVASFLDRWIFVLRLMGSTVMAIAGLYLLRLARTHRIRGVELSRRQLRRGGPAALTFMLYVSSPTLPVFWVTVATIFTSHGLVTHHGVKPILLALSCGAGSLVYYMLVARLGSKLQTVMKPKFFERAYTILGIVLLSLAAFTLIR
ncbi:MAG: LysE family transporter [Candidatus Aminicenantales bacterium]